MHKSTSRRSINQRVMVGIWPQRAKDLSRGHMLNGLGPVIYAVRLPDGLVKIGFTSTLARRCSQLGGMDGLLAVRLGATYAEEQALHDSLAEHVAHGREFYHPTTEVLAVLNAMRDEIGMPPLVADDLAA